MTLGLNEVMSQFGKIYSKLLLASTPLHNASAFKKSTLSLKVSSVLHSPS
jgi:hypothetical protein